MISCGVDNLIKISNEVNALGIGHVFVVPDATFHGK